MKVNISTHNSKNVIFGKTVDSSENSQLCDSFDACTCIIKMCYLFKKIHFTLFNNMTKTTVFILQE